MAAKVFTVLALAVCVSADASYRGLNYGQRAYQGYANSGLNLGGYRGYGGYTGYGNLAGYSRGYARLHKREAEAEPEAEASYGLAPYSAGLSPYRTGFSSYRTGLSSYRSTGLRYGARYPARSGNYYGNSYGRRGLYKRSADADSDASYRTNLSYGTGLSSYRTGLSSYRSTGLRYGARYPARVGNYYGNSYGRRAIYKRSADAGLSSYQTGLPRSYYGAGRNSYRSNNYVYRSPQGARGYTGYGRRALYH